MLKSFMAYEVVRTVEVRVAVDKPSWGVGDGGARSEDQLMLVHCTAPDCGFYQHEGAFLCWSL